MKRLLASILGCLLVIFAQDAFLLRVHATDGVHELRDLPDYIWEYEAQPSRAKVVTQTETVGPSEGVHAEDGGYIFVEPGSVSNKTVDVSFSLSFGFASISTTLPVRDFAINKYGGMSLPVPSEGYYAVEVTSRTRVTPVVAKRKLLGGSYWEEMYLHGTECEVLSLDFRLVRVR